jgi:hypothetical protein
MLYGNVGNCPGKHGYHMDDIDSECKNAGTLRWNGFEYICKLGWISEHTRCEFRGNEGVSRSKWKIPVEVKKKNKWLESWKYPKDHPTDVSLILIFAEEQGDVKGENKEDEEEEEEEEEEEDDGTPEDEVPVGFEMYGMNVAIGIL